VHWNNFEKYWDCPGHDSQFSPRGAVLRGPAIDPLTRADTAAEKREMPAAE